MVSISIRLEPDIIDKLNTLGPYLREALANALLPSVRVVKKETIPNVRVLSGKTRDSYYYSVDKEKQEAYVFSDWFISRFLEYGTIRMRAFPALRPALEACRKPIEQFFIVEIDKAIDKAARA